MSNFISQNVNFASSQLTRDKSIHLSDEPTRSKNTILLLNQVAIFFIVASSSRLSTESPSEILPSQNASEGNLLMVGYIRYCTSSICLLMPASTNLSNMLLENLVLCAFGLKVVAGSCRWSPTSMTTSGFQTIGTKHIGSIDWQASSIIRYFTWSCK